jgi:nucleoid DNA-binding protein
MNKEELVQEVAKKTKQTNKNVKEVLDAALEAITKTASTCFFSWFSSTSIKVKG